MASIRLAGSKLLTKRMPAVLLDIILDFVNDAELRALSIVNHFGRKEVQRKKKLKWIALERQIQLNPDQHLSLLCNGQIPLEILSFFVARLSREDFWSFVLKASNRSNDIELAHKLVTLWQRHHETKESLWNFDLITTPVVTFPTELQDLRLPSRTWLGYGIYARNRELVLRLCKAGAVPNDMSIIPLMPFCSPDILAILLQNGANPFSLYVPVFFSFPYQPIKEFTLISQHIQIFLQNLIKFLRNPLIHVPPIKSIRFPAFDSSPFTRKEQLCRYLEKIIMNMNNYVEELAKANRKKAEEILKIQLNNPSYKAAINGIVTYIHYLMGGINKSNGEVYKNYLSAITQVLGLSLPGECEMLHFYLANTKAFYITIHKKLIANAIVQPPLGLNANPNSLVSTNEESKEMKSTIREAPKKTTVTQTLSTSRMGSTFFGRLFDRTASPNRPSFAISTVLPGPLAGGSAEPPLVSFSPFGIRGIVE